MAYTFLYKGGRRPPSIPPRPTLPPLLPEDNESASRIDAQLHADETKPPPRYSEATLLSAMEGAGKFIDDDDIPF